jgi:hypothetical protein
VGVVVAALVVRLTLEAVVVLEDLELVLVYL